MALARPAPGTTPVLDPDRLGGPGDGRSLPGLHAAPCLARRRVDAVQAGTSPKDLVALRGGPSGAGVHSEPVFTREGRGSLPLLGLGCLSGERHMHAVDLRPNTAPAVRRTRRADDVLEIQRAARRGGTRMLLRWLAARTGANVLLMSPSGAVASQPHAPLGDTERELAQRGVREITLRGLQSVAIDQEDLACIALTAARLPSTRPPAIISG